MKKMSELYGSNIMDDLTEGFSCGKCGKEASKNYF